VITYPFAQPVSKSPASVSRQSDMPSDTCTAWPLPALYSAASAGRHAVYRLACDSAIVLQGWWQAEAGRRRQQRIAEETRAMGYHMLRDIGVGRSGIDRIGLREL